MYIVGLKALSSNCDVYNCSKPILQGSFPLVLMSNLGEIVRMDLVAGLYGPEYHFTTIIETCLPSEMTRLLSWHKKSPLTQQCFSLLIIDIDFMVFHKSLCLTDYLALLANLAIFNEKIEYQTHYECG